MSKVMLPTDYEAMNSEAMEYDGGFDMPTWGWVLVGIGAAAVVGGAAYGIWSSQRHFCDKIPENLEAPSKADYNKYTGYGYKYEGTLSIPEMRVLVQNHNMLVCAKGTRGISNAVWFSKPWTK